MAHKVEDKSIFDSLIVSVRRNDFRFEVEHENGTVEIIKLDPLHPTFLENNNNSINFVSDKPREINISSLDDFENPRELDLAILDNDSRHLMVNGEWIQISKSKEDASREIAIPVWKNGTVTNMGNVVFHNSIIYVAMKDVSTKPNLSSSAWKRLTEYDLFKNRCEIDVPKLNGYFIVSGPIMVRKTIEIKTVDELFDFFNGDMSVKPLFEDIQDYFRLNQKDVGSNEILLFRDTSSDQFNILGISIDGYVDLNDSACDIDIDYGKYAYIHIENENKDNNVGIHSYVKDEDGTYEDNYTSNSTFSSNIDTSNQDKTISTIGIKYRYNDTDNLSKHNISSITITYEELS